jgi:hypothetical protein
MFQPLFRSPTTQLRHDDSVAPLSHLFPQFNKARVTGVTVTASPTCHPQYWDRHNSGMTPEDIAKTLVDQALTLQREVPVRDLAGRLYLPTRAVWEHSPRGEWRLA